LNTNKRIYILKATYTKSVRTHCRFPRSIIIFDRLAISAKLEGSRSSSKTSGDESRPLCIV